jgi:VWFA-related protein
MARTAILFAVALTAGVSAQQPQIPGAFKSRITMVPVDVRVIDRAGRPVTDLTRADFQVLEDGRPQEIGAFEHVVFSAEPGSPATGSDARPALRRVTGPDLEVPSGRVFLFVLGRGRLQYPTRILDALVEFVDTTLLPQDHVAVIAYNRATDFTREHHKIKAVIAAFREKHERIESKMTAKQGGLAAIFGGKDVPAGLQPEVDAIFSTAGAPGFREMPPGRATDAARIEQDMRDVGNLLNPVGVSQPVGGLAPEAPADLQTLDAYMEGNVKTLQDLGGLFAGIEYLRYLDGEKHLVYVTEFGLQMPSGDYDVSLANVAADARVVVDVIHTG